MDQKCKTVYKEISGVFEDMDMNGLPDDRICKQDLYTRFRIDTEIENHSVWKKKFLYQGIFINTIEGASGI